MITDLQKASVLKRASAWLLDFILLITLATGCMALISYVTNFDHYDDLYRERYDFYEKEYNTKFEPTQEEFDAYTEEELERREEAMEALFADEQAAYAYNMMMSLTLLIATLGILAAFLILEFAVPLWLKNGQTVGKKAFGIAVMRTGGYQINTVCLFVRSILGKFTVETMIPVLVMIMLMLSVTGIFGTFLVVGIGIAQLIAIVITRTNSAIHDLMADTVVVDLATQMIFETPEDRLEYEKRLAAEQAAEQTY